MSYKKDVDGNLSSKRVWGDRLFKIGVAMGVLLFVVGLYGIINEKSFNYDLAIEVWWTFMGGGAGLLGFTLFERYGNTKGNVRNITAITPPGDDPPPEDRDPSGNN